MGIAGRSLSECLSTKPLVSTVTTWFDSEYNQNYESYGQVYFRISKLVGPWENERAEWAESWEKSGDHLDAKRAELARKWRQHLEEYIGFEETLHKIEGTAQDFMKAVQYCLPNDQSPSKKPDSPSLLKVKELKRQSENMETVSKAVEMALQTLKQALESLGSFCNGHGALVRRDFPASPSYGLQQWKLLCDWTWSWFRPFTHATPCADAALAAIREERRAASTPT